MCDCLGVGVWGVWFVACSYVSVLCVCVCVPVFLCVRLFACECLRAVECTLDSDKEFVACISPTVQTNMLS